MIQLENVIYRPLIHKTHDIWAIHGKVYNHPRFENGSIIAISSPIAFDEDTNIITTENHTYQILSYHINKSEFVRTIKNDIKEGGYQSFKLRG